MTTGHAAQRDKLTADEILGRMGQTYQRCKSYVDSGVVRTVFITPDGRRGIAERPFTTAFVRPDRFRFEFQDNFCGRHEWDRFIVWRQGTLVQTWWDIKPGVETPSSLAMALASATGVSGGAAHTVPCLLLGAEIGGWYLTELQDAHRIPDAMIEEVPCYRIQGKYADEATTIWIDSASFLLRRLDGSNDFVTFRTESTTTYEGPVINGQVPDEKLAFGSPGRK